MFKTILVTLFLLSGTISYAAEEIEKALDPETKAICNRVILNVYKDILKVKDKYPELKNFDEKVLFENKHGIYTLVYSYADEAAGGPEGTSKGIANYQFGLTIDGMKDSTFPDQTNTFNFGFPLLGVKLSGYQNKHLLRTQYDIMPLINEYGTLLADHQQKFMPLQVTLRTPKDIYKVKEDIEFEVILTNVSKRHMIVKSLGMKTLYFLFDGMTWGTSTKSQFRGGKKIVLKAGKSLRLKFKGESFQKPRDMEIYCAYRMSIKGINPSGILRFKVVEDQSVPADSPAP